MKIRILKLAGLVFACVFIAISAKSQTDVNGLSLGGAVYYLADTNNPKLFLNINLLNTTNHELVVFTKGLNSEFEMDATNQWTCTIGYSGPGVTCQGHLVVPSFYDFAPVTLRPNEMAVVTKEIDLGVFSDLPGQAAPHWTKDTRITVNYAISPEWASRFGTWSGSVKSMPLAIAERNP